MATDPEQPLILRDNPDARRYEALRRGHIAFSEYALDGAIIAFTHTESPPELSGTGVASTLVKFALDDVRARGLRVIPLCPFVAAYIRRHQEYLDLVTPEFQERLQRHPADA